MATNCTRHLQLKSSKGVGHQQTSPWRWFRRAREPPEALPSRRGPFHCHGPGCTRRPVSTHPPHGHHSGGQPTDCLCRSSRDEETLVAAVCVGACPPQMSPVQTGYLHPPVRVLVQAAFARHTANMCLRSQEMSLRASNTGAGIGRCVAIGRCGSKDAGQARAWVRSAPRSTLVLMR